MLRERDKNATAALKAAIAARRKLEREKMASLGIKPSDLKKEREVSYARAQPLIDEAPPVAKAKVVAKPAKKAAVRLVADLRGRGIPARIAFGSRSLKAQMKDADRAGCGVALILGDAELAQGVVLARDLARSEQVSVPIAETPAWLAARGA